MPKIEKKPTKKTTHTDDTETTEVHTTPETSEPSTMKMLTKLGQLVNLLAVLVIALFLFEAYSFYKVKALEKRLTSGTAGAPAAGSQESPFSQEKLISYAEELKLDKKKFEQCLTNGEGKDLVSKDMEQAGNLNVQGTPGFFVNGKFLGGAFPFEVFKEIIDKELDGTATGQCTDYSEAIQQFCSDPNNQAFKPEAQEIALGDSPVKGPKNAKVTIVEFSDFECPFCQRAFPTVQQILDTYKNDVKFTYKHLPLTNIHPNAMRAAEASVCAQKQGKFWEYHDKLFTASSTQ